MISNKLRKYLRDILVDMLDCPVNFFRSNDANTYPYCVFRFEDYTVNDLVQKQLSLTIDLWDKDNFADICDMADTIEQTFKHYTDNTEDFSIQIHSDSVFQPIEDTDKSICRLEALYEIRLTLTE